MRQLLKDVKQALTGVEDVRGPDVFLTPEAAYLREGSMLPALGIKDGGFRQSERAGGVLLQEVTVQVACWVAGEVAIEAADNVLALAEKVSALLLADANFPAGCTWAQQPSQSPSSSLQDSGGGWVQLVVLNFVYTREVPAP